MQNQAKNLVNFGEVILIGSGKGGVGKTLISVNLSVVLNKMGYRVLIFDLDVGFTNSDVLLNLHPEHTMNDLIKGSCNTFDVITPTGYGPDLVSMGSNIESIINFNENSVKEFYTHFINIAKNYDYIIIDLPPGYSEVYAPFFTIASHTLVMTTIHPTSLVNSYTFVKVLIMKGILSNNIHLVGNMIENVQDSTRTLEQFSRVLEKFTGEKLGSLTIIKKHHNVEKSIYLREPFVIKFENIQPSYAVHRIASILTKTPIQKEKTKNILERILSFAVRR
ncbi:AAA family ATPase [Thermosipho ferrireducens]|uniref:AAA family ATPase n=1 Tax=Thermosipho ferrireducens TaxID=2571116 RepID=A0ABX7S5L2_9BACT|nr:P-loop NTPase [Thermosipho ferrireducens]QTA37839.1 AAA family ATPase [Thermosipho ferrireducens]